MFNVIKCFLGEDEEEEDLVEVVEADFYKSIETEQKKESPLETALCEEPEVTETPTEQ